MIGVRTAFWAGWHATQAGRELPVVRVTGNHVAFAAEVSIDPVELEYRPRNLAVAGGSMLAGLLGAAAALIIRRRPKAVGV